LTVTNFESAVSWYHKHFGFVLISEKVLDKKTVTELWPLYQVANTTVRLGFLRAPGGQVLEIFEFSNQVKDPRQVWNAPGVTHFTLDVKHVHQWVSQNRGILNFIIEPQTTDGNDWVFLRDPDGNLIELIDLKMNYHIIRKLGGIVGAVMKKTIYKRYYS